MAAPRKPRKPRGQLQLLALLGLIVAACVAAYRHFITNQQQGGGRHARATAAAAAAPGGRGLLGINLEALDGTGGRQGPRRWNDSAAARAAPAGPFPDTTVHLTAKERATYRKWVAWSEKPLGLDYLQPSTTHFSLGKTRPFKGDINQPGVLKAALEARSYKSEIIYFCMAGLGVADIGLNFLFNLRDLGYDHWIALVGNEADCDRLEAAVGNAGCVWNSIFEVDDAPEAARGPEAQSNPKLIWVLRWLATARTLRFGYNVFCIDSDVMIHDDMYKYLKGPLLGNLTWVCGDEDYGINCNGGTNYIQNAAPDGGAAWMAGTMADWMLRILESPEGWADGEFTRGTSWSSAADDQAMLHSLLRSATLGFVVMPHLYRGLDEAEIQKASDEQPWISFDERNMLSMPGEWRERFQFDEIGMRWHAIAVPARQLTPVLTAPRKPFSRRYWDLLSSESGAPMWPDEPMLAASPRPPAARQEYVGKTMDFTIQTWKTGYLCGRWWGLKPPRGAIGHTVLIPNGAFSRVFLFKVAGWYHWKVEQLAVEHYKRPGFYPHWPVSQQEPPRMLLYAPALQFRNVTHDEWRAITINLVTAAHVLGRVLVWPLLPCGTEWLVNAEDADPRESEFLRRSRWCHVPKGCTCGVDDHWFGTPWEQPAMPIVDENYPLERKACMTWRGYDRKCVSMMYPDFKHMLRRLPAAASAATASNTLFAEGLTAPERPHFERLLAEELRAAVQQLLGDKTVVYLGAVPHLPAEAGRAATAESAHAHELCSRPMLGWEDGAQFQAFVSDKLPGFGAAAASETRRRRHHRLL